MLDRGTARCLEVCAKRRVALAMMGMSIRYDERERTERYIKV